MTALILWAMLKWWEVADRKEALKWLFVVAVLFGLDFSVHRTNAILLPGLAVWLGLRRPRTFISARAWLYGVAGLVCGLAFHFLIIPMAAANPVINGNDPSNLGRFWEYVTLKQYGGGFLVNLFPRKAPFWSHQIVDYMKALGENFFYVDGKLAVVGLLPCLLGLMGLVTLWRRSWRLGAGVLAVFTCSSLGLVFYLNIPGEFFRAFARHYLPSFVIIGFLIVYGARSLTILFAGKRGIGGLLLTVAAVLLVGASAANQILSRYVSVDNSYNRMADDSARNYLKGLDENAILFTAGDTDTWLPLYLQVAEGYRDDVTICNMNLLNTSWFVRTLLEREPEFPLKLTPEQLSEFTPTVWQDSTVMIPAEREEDTLEVLVQGTNFGDYQVLMVSDQLLLEIIRENHWRRPIYFTYPPRWLTPHLRYEGMVLRLMPLQEAALDTELLRRNLLENYGYGGYDDASIPLEQPAVGTAMNLMKAFVSLAMEDLKSDDLESYRQVIEKMDELFPVERIERPDHVKAFLEQLEAEAERQADSAR